MLFLQLNCFTKLKFMQRECFMKSADNTEFYYLMDFRGGPAVGRLPTSEWHPWVQSLVQDWSTQQSSGACLHWVCTGEPQRREFENYWILLALETGLCSKGWEVVISMRDPEPQWAAALAYCNWGHPVSSSQDPAQWKINK